MGNQLNDCCHSTINVASDIHNLRHQTSGSMLLMEEAKSTKSVAPKSINLKPGARFYQLDPAICT